MRRVSHKTKGQSHGGITRLVSPSDLGMLIKPFVFLDQIVMKPNGAKELGMHPHSGIATVTIIHEGSVSYRETTGANGVLSSGDIEWMRASGGVWHGGGLVGEKTVKGHQLWLSLPPHLENIESESRYIRKSDIQSVGSARLILGEYAGRKSGIPSPENINYFDVELKAGEEWSYQTPTGHDIAWLSIIEGELTVNSDPVTSGEMAILEEGDGIVNFKIKSDSRFVFGSAIKHPYELHLGNYSVHTSKEALIKGEANIKQLGKSLLGE